MALHEVQVPRESLERFASLIGEERAQALAATAARAGGLLEGRTVWNVNTTAAGGGVGGIVDQITDGEEGLLLRVRRTRRSSVAP